MCTTLSRPASLTPEEVCHAHASRVYKLARQILGNDQDAEDVTQDVLLQVVRKLGSFRGDSALATWLHRVTVNAALALRRKRCRKAERQPDGSLDRAEAAPSGRGRAATPDAELLAGELSGKLRSAIAALAPAYRDVLVLADVEGLANAAVGGLLGLSLAAVTSRLHRARLMLRDALAPYLGNGHN